MPNRLKLNCDLGEQSVEQAIAIAATVMPHIDQANITCGLHAGDAQSMRAVLAIAKTHATEVGAHPSYPDRENFGRKSLVIPPDELTATLHYQIAALEGMAASMGIPLSYVKPHGALYNDLLVNSETLITVMTALRDYHRPLPLMLQATTAADEHQRLAKQHGLTLIFEAFADRAYRPDGRLVSRATAGAVLDANTMLKQVQQLAKNQTVTTEDGSNVPIRANSLCVHGDHPDSVATIAAIRTAIHRG